MPTCSISVQERAECGYVVFIIGCPGCGANHVFMVGNDDPKRNWTFNGNLKRPTFKPSMVTMSLTVESPLLPGIWAEDW